jgi:4-amino-4-deoxy-L-arabinose transferase-like glycosyltransferase
MSIDPKPTRGIGRPLAILLFAALFVRLLALWMAWDARLVLDEQLYLIRADALLRGEGFVGSFQSWVLHPDVTLLVQLPQYTGSYQPPLYTLFIASILAIPVLGIGAVKLVQVLLGVLTVLLVFRIASAWFDERCGLVAAALCAFYPNFIAFSHYLWSETLFVFLLTLAFAYATKKATASRTDIFVAGLLFGLAALTRSAIVYFLPVLGLWLFWIHRSEGRRALIRPVLLLAALIPIAPWTVRNASVNEGFVLIDTNGPFNLWRGNTPTTFADRENPPGGTYASPFDGLPLMPVARQNQRLLVDTVKRDLAKAQPTDLEIARHAWRESWRYIVEDPVAFVHRGWIKMIDMWNPTSFLLRQFRVGAYGDAEGPFQTVFSWCAILAYLMALGAGLAGLAVSYRDPRAWIVIALILFFTAIHALTFGLTRFRLPLMPFLIIFAARAITLRLRGQVLSK